MTTIELTELPSLAELAAETTEQTLARWDRRDRLERQSATDELADLLARVRRDRPELRFLVAGYNGCGDSGGFEYCGFVRTEDDTEDGDAWTAPEHLVQEFPAGMTTESVMDLLGHFLPGGYENNDGGQGVLTVELATGAVEVGHAWNVCEVEEDPRSFQLDLPA